MFDVILDRDGILNIDVGYTHRIEDIVLPHRSAEALILLRDIGARFSVATDQAGIARGKYSEADMRKFNEALFGQYAKRGIIFSAVVFCPHHPSINGDCECRKPKTGMLRQIEDFIGPIDWERAWGIGDKPSDAEMILAKGGRSVLVKSDFRNNRTGEPYWNENDPSLVPLFSNERNFVADSLWEAATLIKSKMI